jgi:RHS repeat-associated protein
MGSCWHENLTGNPASNLNQLANYCYDAAGNLVLNNTCPGGTFTPTYAYDAENRLSSTAGYTYYYDANGVRMEKSNGTSGTMYRTGPGGEYLTETDLTGSTINEEYIYFNGARIARVDRPSGTVHYYFSDQLNSASTITDPSGTVQERYYYYPYGGLVTSIGSDTNHYKFTGKERDSESNLDYFGARHYASTMGRFMSADRYNVMLTRYNLEAGGLPSEAADAFLYGHIENPQNWNQYAYVRNNPLNLVDPTGAAAIPGGDGHHLIPQAIARTLSSPIARDFANKIATGPPNVAPNAPGFGQAHIEYNAAVEEVLEEAEQTMGDRNSWNIAQWKDVANQILNSSVPAIRNFLDELDQNNPNARAALGAAIAAYRVSAMLAARVIAAALASEIVRMPLIIYVDVKSAFRHPDEEADRRPPHKRCLMTRDGKCVN